MEPDGKINWRCIFRLHYWDKWSIHSTQKIIKSDGGGHIGDQTEQRRQCLKCLYTQIDVHRTTLWS